MRKYIIYSVLCLSMWLTGCEKEVTNIKLPQNVSKLVVTSFISPQDTMLTVSIIKSVPAIGKSTFFPRDNVKDATVSLSDGEKSISLMYNGYLYTAQAKDFAILAGKTYFLNVSTPEGSQVEASCTVPLTQNNTLEVTLDSTEVSYGSGKEYFALIKWQDIPGEVNFYRVSAEMQTTFLFTRRDTGSDTILTRYESLNWDGTVFFSDNRLDGSRFSSPKGRIYSISYPTPEEKIYAKSLDAHLLNTDEHYYRYHQSIRNSNNDNPFAEPVPIYSNINGGLGVFAAYNQATVSIKFK